jgi:hypothetical protein
MSRLLRRLIAPAAPVIQRDTVRLRLGESDEIDVLRVRDPRARRLKLSVDERGARLTLPLRASLASGEQFLHANRQWLQQQLARFSDQALPVPTLRLRQPGQLPLRGDYLPVQWQVGRFARVELGAPVSRRCGARCASSTRRRCGPMSAAGCRRICPGCRGRRRGCG